MGHHSVLLKEVIDGLSFRPGDVFLDGTVGEGGHSAAVCGSFGPAVKVIGLDQDIHSVAHATERLKNCGATVIHENFRNLDRVLDQLTLSNVDKILLDLGWSSVQLESSGRGFSFQKDEPLLMTLEVEPSEDALTAATIVNTFTEEEIADIIYRYGEERKSRRIARVIVEERKKKPIVTSGQLREVIEKAMGGSRGRIHPATRTFQALRIAVNDELKALEEGLRKGFARLKPQGRMAVISFHSLEDRIVKHFIQEKVKEGAGRAITKKPIRAGEAEIKENPRARSAKLRIIEKN